MLPCSRRGSRHDCGRADWARGGYVLHARAMAPRLAPLVVAVGDPRERHVESARRGVQPDWRRRRCRTTATQWMQWRRGYNFDSSWTKLRRSPSAKPKPEPLRHGPRPQDDASSAAPIATHVMTPHGEMHKQTMNTHLITAHSRGVPFSADRCFRAAQAAKAAGLPAPDNSSVARRGMLGRGADVCCLFAAGGASGPFVQCGRISALYDSMWCRDSTGRFLPVMSQKRHMLSLFSSVNPLPGICGSPSGLGGA